MLVFEFRKGLNASDGRVSHGESGPAVASDAETRGKGEKKIVALGITGGGKGNGAKGPRANRVGRFVVVEQLHVRAKFQTEVVVVRGWNTRHQGKGTERLGDAVGSREHV